MAKRRLLGLEKRGRDWWITRVPSEDCPECGPYDRRGEADEAREGLERFFEANPSYAVPPPRRRTIESERVEVEPQPDSVDDTEDVVVSPPAAEACQAIRRPRELPAAIAPIARPVEDVFVPPPAYEPETPVAMRQRCLFAI